MRNFSLYTVELRSSSSDLLEIAKKLTEYAEIDYFDQKSGKVRIRFMSTATTDEVVALCDEFKKDIEADGSTRLAYNVTSTM